MTANGVRINGYEYGHHHRFDASAEGVAMDFERDMMQDTLLHARRTHSDKKRSHALESDIGDIDSTDMKDDVPGPSIKRRKLENGTATNGIEHPFQEPSISLKLSLSKLKGKMRQQREPSLDSVSTGTPKTRKKPGPKKRTGLALEVETEQGSGPASLLGDITPASRPSSPAPLNMTMVYELDEHLPPLKKAKKVDDSILIKRIKTLEEAQKKVWTNLARRDIVKVNDTHSNTTEDNGSSFSRFTNITRLAIRHARHSWSVSQSLLRFKRASLLQRLLKLQRMSKPKPNVSCAKCRFSGRRMKRKKEICASVS